MTYKIRYRLFLIAFVVLCMTVLIVTETYALFETNATGVSEMDIGAWKILLNDVDLSLTQEITLTDFTYSASQHRRANHFAPGTTATFDIEIDTSEADVSVEYEIEIDDSAIEDYDNIYFTIKDMTTNQTITSNTVTGTILLSSANRVKTLRLSLIWDNDPDYDESDSTLIGEELEFPVTANFKQYVG